jgi:arylsulfatase A-like enzyme
MERFGRIGLAAGLCLLAAACGPDAATREAPPRREASQPQAGPQRPSFVLVVICSLRYDHLGFAGYPRGTTPFLDSLARGGVRFAHAMSASTWTKPATASLLTGLTPNVHGLTDYYAVGSIQSRGFAPRRTLADSVVTLAELLSGAGYATFARNNNVHAGVFFNLMQGFDDAGPAVTEEETPALLEDFERWLDRRDPARPFFFFLLTRDAHVTYQPAYESYRRFAAAPVPEDAYADFPFELMKALKRARSDGAEVPEAQQRQWIDLYDGELAQLDAALAELPGILERAGRSRETVVVVSADHGEHFFDPHGSISHGGPILDEPLVHVPLVFQGPGIPAGRVVEDVVRSIDVYPTLAQLAGVEPPPVVQGRSLVPFWTDAPAPPPASAFASFEEPVEEAGSGPPRRSYAVRLGRHKLEQRPDGSVVLYDLERDPLELEDRVGSDPETVLNLKAELDRWLAEETALGALVARGETRELSPEVLEQLRELGYVKEEER